MKKYGKEPDYLRLKRELEAGTLHPVYIFTGSEDFLMQDAVAAVYGLMEAKAAVSTDYSRIEGPQYALGDVLDMVDTVSLFGDSRMVTVADAPYFAKGAGSKEDLAKLQAYLARRDAASCVVFCARDFMKTTKAAKELAASGGVFVFEPLKGAALADWLRKRVASVGKTASSHTLNLLVERVGRDLRRLANEVDKLATYLGDDRQELDESTVMLATSRSIQGDIFALTDAVVYGRAPKALFLLKDLLGAGEPPLRILAMLVRQFRLLGSAHELLNNGCRADELSARLGIHPYAAEKLVAQAYKASDAQLGRAVELLLQTDLDIKRGKIDQVLALETLVVALGEKSA
ncbi:DNA polymerase III subunit delta [Dethiobacter alkaliphilus]|uniref:DNA polymerase III subunit delta n=1 Tax=Dethiobacter alkaliphilus AHT 1 TaxID=555088 RepID=C0GEN0_DETAL|nr:DNA polymerase III subunit delta [Dethiobacter alkaliphilus]EEG78062.1 DNA polymerase III, delta subunit [Dethiobacter alkaliphilus AHT 1]